MGAVGPGHPLAKKVPTHFHSQPWWLYPARCATLPSAPQTRVLVSCLRLPALSFVIPTELLYLSGDIKLTSICLIPVSK